MFDRFTEYWDKNGLELLAGVAVVCIIFLYFYNWWTNAKGTYSVREVVPQHSGEVDHKVGGVGMVKPFEMMQHTPNDSRLELQSKFILEDIFKRPFYKVRPEFLKNDVTGCNLEIDLFNDELKLAVEVQGDQHYKFTPFFHRNKEHFLNQRYRDEMKKWKCKAYGITLIEVPYRIGEKKLRSFIIDQLRAEGFLA